MVKHMGYPDKGKSRRAVSPACRGCLHPVWVLGIANRTPRMTSFDDQPNRTGTGSLKWDRYLAGDILPLWVADMDFGAAEVIVEALRRRCDHGVFGYTVPYAEVEEAVLEYQWTRHGIRAERDWIVWMPGVVPALNLVCLAYAGTGEGVLTATPVYPPFLTAPVNQGRVLKVGISLFRDAYSGSFSCRARLYWPAIPPIS